MRNEEDAFHRGRGCAFIELILYSVSCIFTTVTNPYPLSSPLCYRVRLYHYSPPPPPPLQTCTSRPPSSTGTFKPAVYSTVQLAPLRLRKYNHLGPLYIRPWEEDNELGSAPHLSRIPAVATPPSRYTHHFIPLRFLFHSVQLLFLSVLLVSSDLHLKIME